MGAKLPLRPAEPAAAAAAETKPGIGTSSKRVSAPHAALKLAKAASEADVYDYPPLPPSPPPVAVALRGGVGSIEEVTKGGRASARLSTRRLSTLLDRNAGEGSNPEADMDPERSKGRRQTLANAKGGSKGSRSSVVVLEQLARGGDQAAEGEEGSAGRRRSMMV
jgi:hypothetical protein